MLRVRVRVRVRFSVNCNNYNPAKILSRIELHKLYDLVNCFSDG